MSVPSRKTVILIPDSMAWVLGTWATEIRRWNSKDCRFVIFPASEIQAQPSLFLDTARKANIIHCLSKWDFPMVRALLDRNGVPGIKVISSIHHIMKDEPLSTTLDADRIMVVCNRYRDQILHVGVPAAKLFKIYNGANTDEFLSKDRIAARKVLGLPQDGLFIGFAGKFSSNSADRKGIDIFTKVIKMMPPELQSMVHFVITGPGWENTLQQVAAGANRIHYLSFIDRERMPDFYNSLDIYLVTARVEGGPMPVIEAMSCGIPVISTPVGMVPDFIRDGENGIMIDHDDVSGAVAAIRRLSANERLRKKIGEQARKTVIDHLQWRTTLSGMNGLYDFTGSAQMTAEGKGGLTDAQIEKLSAELIKRDIARWQRIFRNEPAAGRQPIGSNWLAQIKLLANHFRFLRRKN
ncbi:MAG: glycosyltransferase family 4 protein [candidate division Zixibacteria bacterium]|nr:glycosyltransferase family 4 protein [candidate division Zixibacteria bacterium]